MKIVEVQVKQIPVRYGIKTYQPGETFEMEEAHVNDSLVEVTGEVEVAPKEVEDMTIAELKEYAVENEIDLGAAKKRDEILEAIQTTEIEKKTPKK